MAQFLSEQRSTVEFPQSQRLAARPSLSQLFSGVGDKASRDEQIHKAMRFYEYTLRELSNHLGLHYSTISVIAKRGDEQQGRQKQRPDPFAGARVAGLGEPLLEAGPQIYRGYTEWRSNRDVRRPDDR